ncbi:MAG: YisL family protein [Bacillus sp. (in: firmicutes)]
MTHMHITTWALAIILVIVATVLLKKGNQKGYKITHMILRIDYLLIIATGFDLFGRAFSSNIAAEYITKAVLGLVVIGLAEMLLGKMSKQQSAKGIGTAFVIVLLVIIAFGFNLPLGLNFLQF